MKLINNHGTNYYLENNILVQNAKETFLLASFGVMANETPAINNRLFISL